MSPRDRLPLLLLALAGSLGMHLVAQQLGLVPALHGLTPAVVVALTCAAGMLGRDARWSVRTVAVAQLPIAGLLELLVHAHAGVLPAPSTLLLLVALHIAGVAATSRLADLLIPDHVPVPIQLLHSPVPLCPRAPQVVDASMLTRLTLARGPPSTAASLPYLRS